MKKKKGIHTTKYDDVSCLITVITTNVFRNGNEKKNCTKNISHFHLTPLQDYIIYFYILSYIEEKKMSHNELKHIFTHPLEKKNITCSLLDYIFLCVYECMTWKILSYI